MLDKVETIKNLVDIVSLNPEEIESLVDLLRHTPRIEPRFTPGDPVKTRNGDGYVHKTVGTGVLVRYVGRHYEEWVNEDSVYPRNQLQQEVIDTSIKVGDKVIYGTQECTVVNFNYTYCVLSTPQNGTIHVPVKNVVKL